jgi:hypothetical protein
MKLKTLSLAAFILAQINCMAQTSFSSNKTPGKEEYLSTALEKAKSIKNESDLQNSINEIKRIEVLDANYWLPSYYVSYMETTQSFYTTPDKKEALLEDAKARINKLLDNPLVDKSELYTVLGYYYYAKIAQDPQNNGQLFYKDVITNYQKAIGINPANPRPNYLLHLFEDKMSSFMGKQDSNLCEKLQKDKKLFEDFKVADKNYPNWGEKEIVTNLQKCAK